MAWTNPTLSAAQLPSVTSGTVHTVGECFEKLIEPRLPAVEVVHHWHELLLKYVAQPTPTLFIRRYGKDDRRGYLSLDENGFGYVYCDNYFAQLIAEQVLAGRCPSLADLNDAIADRTIPIGKRISASEKLAAFRKTKSPRLNDRKWKLAHLHPVGSNYHFNYRKESTLLFPKGVDSQWAAPDHIRRVSAVPANDREKMAAHFLRMVHPANYFLCPIPAVQSYNGKDVGEDVRLLRYVHNQFCLRYGKLLQALEAQIMLPELSAWPTVTADTPLHLTLQGPGDSPKSTVSVLASVTKGEPTRKQVPITFNPSSEADFKAGLVVRRKAIITLTRMDGSTFSKEWNAAGFKATSSLRDNLLGHRALRSSARVAEGIVAVHVTLAP